MFDAAQQLLTIHGAKKIFDRTPAEVFLYSAMSEIHKACVGKESYICIRLPEDVTPEEVQKAFSGVLLFKTKFYRNNAFKDVVCYVFGWSDDVAGECAPMSCFGRYEEFEPNLDIEEVA